MRAHPSRLLIVDQSLRDMAGHHYEYDVALFEAAMKVGVPVVIGAHQSVQTLPILADNVRARFKKPWYETQGDHFVKRAVQADGMRAAFGRWYRRAAFRAEDVVAEAGSGATLGSRACGARSRRAVRPGPTTFLFTPSVSPNSTA
jgi:hypothetical protein